MTDIRYPSRALNATIDSVTIATVGVNLDVDLHDGSGNPITSQVNGSQQALDVGVNVAGVQVDPRDIRALTNADVVSAEQSGTWSVDAVQSGTWSVDSVQSGTWSVDAVQSGTWSVTALDASEVKTGSYLAGVTGDIIASFDASAYKYFSLQLIMLGAGNITVQESNDNTNWFDVPVSAGYVTANPPFITINQSDMVNGYIKGKYLKVNVSSNASGVSVSLYLANGASNDLAPKMVGILSGYDGVSATQSGTWSVDAVQSGSWSVDAVQSGSWSVDAVQSGTWTVQPGNTPNSTPWLVTLNQGGNSATVTASNALKVDGSAVTQPVSIASLPAGGGRSTVLLYTNNYASVNVTTSAYVQVVASTTGDINRLYIADTSGSAIILAVGGAGSEVDKLYIGPGGNEAPYELNIPSGSRIAIKALDVNATSGRIIITALS